MARRLDLPRVGAGSKGGGAARDCTFDMTGIPVPERVFVFVAVREGIQGNSNIIGLLHQI